MKKILIAAIAVLGFTTANAQYTAEKGDFQTSVDFRPFASSGDMFSNVGINGTYFLSDKDAVRVGLNFGSSSVKDASSSNNFGISLGYENHFKSYDRVDLYAGAEVSYKTGTEKEKTTVGDVIYDLKKQGSANEIGVGIFTGINYYFYKKLYVGAEISFNYTNASLKKYDSLATTESGDYKVVEVDPKGSSNSFAFNVRPALRLGWTF